MTDLEAVAARLFWWKPPQEALADPSRFLAQVMVYSTLEDVLVARRHFSDEDLRKVMESPPPGLFDPRSWAYWNVVLGLDPDREMPRRRF